MHLRMNTVVGFGASSMQGVGDSQGGFLQRVVRRCQEGELPVQIHNKGIGGQSTPAMLSRMGELSSLRPYDLVVILGCNDLPRDRDNNVSVRTSLDVYTANLRRLFPAIRGRRSLFISSFAVSQERTGIDPVLFTGYMEVATSLADSCGYDIWDLFKETKGRTGPLLANDGMHFNDEGHALIADHVFDWLAAESPDRTRRG